MKKKLIAGVVIFIAGFLAAFILMGYYNSWAEQRALEAELPESSIQATAAVPENAPVPQITIDAFVDSADGYNLHFVTENFTFSPGLVGEARTPSTGYAMIYINGKPAARTYGSWYHVSYEQLAGGQNTVEVVLKTNDHANWVVAGNRIEDTVNLEKIQ